MRFRKVTGMPFQTNLEKAIAVLSAKTGRRA